MVKRIFKKLPCRLSVALGSAGSKGAGVGLAQTIQIAAPPTLGLGATGLLFKPAPAAAVGAEEIYFSVALLNELGVLGVNRHHAHRTSGYSRYILGHDYLPLIKESCPSPDAKARAPVIRF
jgi:hypothetical protein